jgi:hypothetical protein
MTENPPREAVIVTLADLHGTAADVRVSYQHHEKILNQRRSLSRTLT